MSQPARIGHSLARDRTSIRVGGDSLRPRDVVDVATNAASAELDPVARSHMLRARTLTRRALAGGASVYGLTTGVGAQKQLRVANQNAFNRLLILDHCVGHGAFAPPEFVRAAMIVRAHGLALGGAGVHPRVVDALLAALNANVVPRVHLIGSIGQADLAPLAEIARALIGEGPDGDRVIAAGLTPLRLSPGEGLALMSANAFSVGIAALGLERACAALRALERSAALSFEAFDANISAIDPAVADARPHRGIRRAIQRLRAELEGGTLLEGKRPPRNLQDPLSFRVTPQTHAAAHHTLDEARLIVETELCSSSENPVVVPQRSAIIANGNFDSTPLTVALDYARLGIAQVATIANERILKLLDPRFSGLPAGLRDDPTRAEDGIGVLGHGSTALTGEIRLLAAPVSLEQPTSAPAEGIEDRISLAPVAARRLHEMTGYLTSLAAIELVCAAQAIDLRALPTQLGNGTSTTYHAVRTSIPFSRSGHRSDHNLGPITDWLANS